MEIPGEANELPWGKCMLGCEVIPKANIVLLPCLHVLCSEICVGKLKTECEKEDSKPFCKTCSRKIKLEDLNRKVKLDLFLSKKLELKDIVLKCGMCIMDDPVEAYCPECQLNLCRPCMEFHPRLRDTMGHKLVKNLDERKAIEFELFRDSRNLCESHDGKEFVNFCCTCQRKMCTDCIPVHDKSHSIVVVADEVAAVRSKITTTKEIEGIINLGIAKLEDKLQSLKEAEWKAYLDDLENLMLRVVDLLRVRREALFQEGRKMHQVQELEIGRKITRLKRAREDAIYLQKVWRQGSEALDEFGIINVIKTSLDCTEMLNQVRKDLEEKFDEFVEKDRGVVLKDGLFSNLQAALSQLGSVEMDLITLKPSSPEPSLSVSLPATIDTPGIQPMEAPTSAGSNDEFQCPGPGPSRPRRIAVKSTAGRLTGRPLGMPHLNQRFPAPSLQPDPNANGLPLPTPPILSRQKPPIRTYSSPNQKAGVNTQGGNGDNSTRSNSPVPINTSRDSSGKGAQQTSPKPCVSNDKGTTLEAPNLSSGDTDCPTEERSEIPAVRNRKEVTDGKGNETKGSASNIKENVKAKVNVTEQGQTTATKPKPDGTEKEKGEMKKNSSEIPSDPKVGSGTSNNGDCSVLNNSSNSMDILLGPSPADNDERHVGSQNVDDEMPVLTQCQEPEEVEEGTDENIPKISISHVLSPSSSSSSSDGSLATQGSASGEVRKGTRERRQRVYRDYVDPDTVCLPKKNDLPDSTSTSNGSHSNGSVKRRRSSVRQDTLKKPRVSEEAPNSDDDAVTEVVAPSVIDFPSASETGSENGFESGSENSFTRGGGRRQSLRRRHSSRPSTPSVDSRSSPSTPSTENRSRNSQANNDAEFATLPEAPVDSLESLPPWCDYPIQGKLDPLKRSNDDDSDDYCVVCLDGGDDIIVCCDFCPKVFHLKCHIPALSGLPDKWHCNYDKSKEFVQQEMEELPDQADSENKPLTDANERQFLWACKFMMEVYKIPEIPTMKWVFPELYYEEFQKAPYHLKFIREKLCIPIEKGWLPFANVNEFVNSFRQMFLQAFRVYKKWSRSQSQNRKHAISCLRQFQDLVKEYYPQYHELFEKIER